LTTVFRFLSITTSFPPLFLAISVSQSLVFDAGLLADVEELVLGAGLCLGLRPSTTRLGRFAVGDLLHASSALDEEARRRDERTGVSGSTLLVEEEETGVRG